MDYFILSHVFLKNYWKDNDFIVTYSNNHRLILTRSFLENIADSTFFSLQRQFDDSLLNSKLTHEEASYLVAINMLKPLENQPQYKLHHTRIILSFTRFLEGRYGNDYHLRLREIVNLQAFLNETMIKLKKWYHDNQFYFDKVHCDVLFRSLLAFPNVDEAAKALCELKVL